MGDLDFDELTALDGDVARRRQAELDAQRPSRR
jgi:hypothetical protein